MEVSRLPTPAAYTQKKIPQYPFDRRLSDTQSGSEKYGGKEGLGHAAGN
jgi:hypothetical protein